MTKSPTNGSEHDAINKVVQMYLDGAKSGKGDDMKPAFHKDATVFGYVGPDLSNSSLPGTTRTVQRPNSNRASPALTSSTQSPPCGLNSTTGPATASQTCSRC